MWTNTYYAGKSLQRIVRKIAANAEVAKEEPLLVEPSLKFMNPIESLSFLRCYWNLDKRPQSRGLLWLANS